MNIAVIMSTYNGERYLKEQVESILRQDIVKRENVTLELFVRDDGSTDKTKKILSSFNGNKVRAFEGDNKGYSRSFITCLQNAPGFDYYAFSDQDDFWEADKLKRAIEILETTKEEEDIPMVYYSNVKVSDEYLNVKCKTKLETRNLSMESTFLRRSIAGCTMVFNKKMWNVIFKNRISDNMLSQGHDSFIISLCYAVNGKVFCDHNAYILYRQHTNNTAGSPTNLIKRIKKEIKGIYHDKRAEIQIARSILEGWKDEIPIEKQKSLKLIESMGNNWKVKFKIVLSNKFSTGNLRLTLLEKIKVLIVRE